MLPLFNVKLAWSEPEVLLTNTFIVALHCYVSDTGNYFRIFPVNVLIIHIFYKAKSFIISSFRFLCDFSPRATVPYYTSTTKINHPYQ